MKKITRHPTYVNIHTRLQVHIHMHIHTRTKTGRKISIKSMKKLMDYFFKLI